AVATFGDGQRVDADRRVGEAIYHGFRVVRDEKHVANAADYANLGVRPVVQFHQVIEVILRGQGVAHGLFLGAGANAADAPVHPFAEIHQRAGIGRLVRSMKATDADVGDAGAELFQGVIRPGGGGRQAEQILFVQLHCMSHGKARASRHGIWPRWPATLKADGSPGAASLVQATWRRGWPTAMPWRSNRWQWPASSVSFNDSPSRGVK